MTCFVTKFYRVGDEGTMKFPCFKMADEVVVASDSHGVVSRKVLNGFK